MNFKKEKKNNSGLGSQSIELMSLGITAFSSKLGFCLMIALKPSSDAWN